MPRNLSATSLATIASPLGNEPIIIVEIDWFPTEPTQLYAERTYGEVQGLLLSLSNLDAVISQQSGSVVTATITLDDRNGIFRTLYNTYDIHKKPVRIMQWFAGIPLSERFLLFAGLINSPIVWSEKERTFKFDIASQLEDTDIGFSFELGMFPYIPKDLIGKTWPICFGQPIMVQPIKLGDAPSALLIEYFGIPDKGILEQIERLSTQSANGPEPPKLQEFPEDATLEEINAIIVSNTQTLISFYNGVGQQAAQITEQILQLQETYDDQSKWLRRNRKVTMDKFPEGTYIVKINETAFKATFTRIDKSTGDMELLYEVPSYQDVYSTINGEISDGINGATKDGFKFFNTGSSITIISEYPITYVVNSVPSTDVKISAYRSYKGVRKLTPIPESFYEVTIGEVPASVTQIKYDEQGKYFFNAYHRWLLRGVTLVGNNFNFSLEESWLKPTYITFKRPLSLSSVYFNEQRALAESVIYRDYTGSRLSSTEEWDDEIYVVLTSSLSSNVVDILIWAITTFTNFKIDYPSFDAVKTRLEDFPVNFVLSEQINLLDFLNQLAYESRCSIRLINDTFYLTYLSQDPEAIDIITENDIIAGSLELTSTDTEDLVTKVIATYRDSYLADRDDSKIIVKHNVSRYGIHEESINYLSLTTHFLAKKTASFWLMRHSISWKVINFKCTLNKLNLETADTIFVDLPNYSISNGVVKGTIQSSNYNSVENTVDMSVILSVRVGEMSPFIWYWPADLDETNIFPDDQQFDGATSTSKLIQYKGRVPTEADQPHSQTYGEPSDEDETSNEDQTYIDRSRRHDAFVQYLHDKEKPSRNIIKDYGDIVPENAPLSPEPYWPYELNDYQWKPIEYGVEEKIPSTVYPGTVLSGSGQQYTVEIFPEGLDGSSKSVAVRQLQIDPTEAIPAGTSVMVIKIYNSTTKETHYYMQTPVWL